MIVMSAILLTVFVISDSLSSPVQVTVTIITLILVTSVLILFENKFGDSIFLEDNDYKEELEQLKKRTVNNE